MAQETVQKEQTPETKDVTFTFTAPHLAVLFNIFSHDMGEDLKKLSAVTIQKRFASWLRSILVKGVIVKRNSIANSDYLRKRTRVDALVDEGMERKNAEEEIFEMSGTAYRRKLEIEKKSPLF